MRYMLYALPRILLWLGIYPQSNGNEITQYHRMGVYSLRNRSEGGIRQAASVSNVY